MSGHSKGPWKWGTHDGVTKLYDADGRVIATGEYRRGIVVQGSGNRDLIASAPTLQRQRDEANAWMEFAKPRLEALGAANELLRAERTELQRQRDELLAALRDLVNDTEVRRAIPNQRTRDLEQLIASIAPAPKEKPPFEFSGNCDVCEQPMAGKGQRHRACEPAPPQGGSE